MEKEKREISQLRIISCLSLLGTAFLLSMTGTFASTLGFRLEQRSDFAGRQTVIWRADAIRFHLQKYGLTVILKAPDWNVTVWSTDSQKYCKLTYREFENRFSCKWKTKNRDRLYRGTKSKTIMGMKTYQCFVVGKPVPGPRHQVISNTAVLKNCGEWSEIWLTKDLTMPHVVSNILAAMAGIPENDGLPLRIIRMRKSGVTAVTIDTVDFRRVTIGKDDFKMPPHMEFVKDEMSIFLEDDPTAYLGPDVDLMTQTSKSLKPGADLRAKETIGKTKGRSPDQDPFSFAR